MTPLDRLRHLLWTRGTTLPELVSAYLAAISPCCCGHGDSRAADAVVEHAHAQGYGWPLYEIKRKAYSWAA